MLSGAWSLPWILADLQTTDSSSPEENSIFRYSIEYHRSFPKSIYSIEYHSYFLLHRHHPQISLAALGRMGCTTYVWKTIVEVHVLECSSKLKPPCGLLWVWGSGILGHSFHCPKWDFTHFSCELMPTMHCQFSYTLKKQFTVPSKPAANYQRTSFTTLHYTPLQGYTVF